jgi:hypothetical protein
VRQQVINHKPPPGPDEAIRRQLNNLAHSLINRQPVRVHQLMSLQNDREVGIFFFFNFGLEACLEELEGPP